MISLSHLLKKLTIWKKNHVVADIDLCFYILKNYLITFCKFHHCVSYSMSFIGSNFVWLLRIGWTKFLRLDTLYFWNNNDHTCAKGGEGCIPHDKNVIVPPLRAASPLENFKSVCSKKVKNNSSTLIICLETKGASVGRGFCHPTHQFILSLNDFCAANNTAAQCVNRRTFSSENVCCFSFQNVEICRSKAITWTNEHPCYTECEKECKIICTNTLNEIVLLSAYFKALYAGFLPIEMQWPLLKAILLSWGITHRTRSKRFFTNQHSMLYEILHYMQVIKDSQTLHLIDITYIDV